MAHGAPDDDMITGINVTPLVDVVLVVLVILMLTASTIVARALPMDLPSAATGEATESVLAISIDASGRLHLDAEPVSEAALSAAARRAAERAGKARAMIAADGQARHAHVVRVIDLLRASGVAHFAINVSPAEERAQQR